MTSLVILASILGTLLIGAASPGPTFVLVSRISISTSRIDGLAAALGVGVGGAIFATLAVFGLSALLLQVEWLHLLLKLAGGAYLIYLGIRIWRSAGQPISPPENARVQRSGLQRSGLRAFGIGLLTHLSNPKTAIVYASIFAALLPVSPPLWMLIALPPLVMAVETFWYTAVVLVFSARRPRSVYLAARIWIDRAAGAVMGALGAQLIVSAGREALNR
ncbi:MAG: LysE family translocator [Kiloniellaceae bacterium]